MGSGRKEKKEKSGKLVSLAALFICFESTGLDLRTSLKPQPLKSLCFFPLSPTLTLNPLTPTFPPGDVTMEGDTTVTEGPTYEDKLKFVSVIAKPMASKKLTKKIYKVGENLSHRG